MYKREHTKEEGTGRDERWNGWEEMMERWGVSKEREDNEKYEGGEGAVMRRG